MKSLYDKDYFEDGISVGISCYTNYRWLPAETLKMCVSISEFANIKKDDVILDYGCAKGFLVKAMLKLGYEKVYGVDISDYAVDNCDPEVKDRIFRIINNDQLLAERYDCIICKDVLEHISYKEIDGLIQNFRAITKNLLVIVPLGENNKYVIEDYERDKTHVIRESLQWWRETLERNGFKVEKSLYRVEGIKDNWASYETGNGFFVCA